MLSQRRQSRRQLRKPLLSRQLCELPHYFPRLLRQVHTGLSLSHEVVNVMDLFVKDIFEWIAKEARCLASSNNHCTITSGDIQTVVCLLLPGEVCKYAMSEATKSVIRYNCCR